jgi:hypothetical protein
MKFWCHAMTFVSRDHDIPLDASSIHCGTHCGLQFKAAISDLSGNPDLLEFVLASPPSKLGRLS